MAALLARARGTDGAARRLIARKLNAVLRSMRSPGNEAAVAEAVLAGLERKQFDELAAPRPCRRCWPAAFPTR